MAHLVAHDIQMKSLAFEWFQVRLKLNLVPVFKLVLAMSMILRLGWV